MTTITRLLTATDPAKELEITLDERAEAELALLLGPAPTDAPATRRVSKVRPSRLRPFVVTGVVAAAVAAITISVLVAVPNSRHDVGDTTASPTPSTTRSTPSVLGLAKRVWQVAAAAGEGDSTWLRFRGHDVQAIRRAKTLDFGWRAQGDQLLFSPDSYVVGLGGADTVQWLEDSTAFRADGTGYDLLDSRGTVTARLTAAGNAPVRPVSVTSSIRDDLADAQPGAVRPIAPTALRGSWSLQGVSRLNAWVTFHTDGTWISSERCAAAGGPETDIGGYRLLDSGVLLATTQTGQALACQDSHADGATTSTLTLLLQGRSVRIDGTTATIYDRHGALLGRLTRS
jgi:hypothetical protein